MHWFKRDRTKNGPPKASLHNLLVPQTVVNEWQGRCLGIRANVELNLITYVAQPRPRKGNVDLASVFFLRSALQKENLFFGERCAKVEMALI